MLTRLVRCHGGEPLPEQRDPPLRPLAKRKAGLLVEPETVHASVDVASPTPAPAPSATPTPARTPAVFAVAVAAVGIHAAAAAAAAAAPVADVAAGWCGRGGSAALVL